ncbi:hypothetical protein R3P38DRAFT_2804582 [Favolaschia claudopus]|uniref:Uncharacterized protein n=1 Tax=Favolaschia claudopus TaxID=2862362 RepID=A0AAV9ZPP9_9AGAR
MKVGLSQGDPTIREKDITYKSFFLAVGWSPLPPSCHIGKEIPTVVTGRRSRSGAHTKFQPNFNQIPEVGAVRSILNEGGWLSLLSSSEHFPTLCPPPGFPHRARPRIATHVQWRERASQKEAGIEDRAARAHGKRTKRYCVDNSGGKCLRDEVKFGSKIPANRKPIATFDTFETTVGVEDFKEAGRSSGYVYYEVTNHWCRCSYSWKSAAAEPLLIAIAIHKVTRRRGDRQPAHRALIEGRRFKPVEQQ